VSLVVQPSLFGLFQIESPLGPGQRNKQKADGSDQESHPDFLAGSRNTDRQIGQESRLDKLRDELPLGPPGPPEKGRERRDGRDQQPQKVRVFEAHVG